MPEFLLPDVGEGLTEAEIVAWHVKVGDVVEVNEPLCDIETAKSVVELPSPYAGTVTALLVEVGETVTVGTPIIAVGEAVAPSSADGPVAPAPTATPPVETPPVETPPVETPPAATPPVETPPAAEAAPAAPAASATSDAPQTLVGYGPRETGTVRRPRRTPATVGVAPAPVGVLAKPPVRRLAADLGVDLAAVVPTGPHGTVSREDVEAAATPAPVASAPATSAPVEAEPAAVPQDVAETRREPVKGVRKAMAQAMVTSAFTAPHVTIWTTVDVTATTGLVERLRARREFADLRVSPLLVVARAVTLAMRRTPLLNARYVVGEDGAPDELELRERVHLGIAAATPRGLVVPHVRDADRLSLVELARAVQELTDTARAGRTTPEAQAGGTFTITNVGPFGMEGGTPILNPGESGILCLGAVERRPWVVGEGEEERVVPRDVVTLALSFDHRHVDGATGSAFLRDVASVLEDPVHALLL